MNIEIFTGYLALIVTLGYTLAAYPRELYLTIRGKSKMGIAFQMAASCVFCSWAIHACSKASTTGIDWFLLIPNAVGMCLAVALTSVLIHKKRVVQRKEQNVERQHEHTA